MRQPAPPGRMRHRLPVLAFIAALLLPTGAVSADHKIRVQEILATKSAADIGHPETDISLLDDDVKDTVLRVYGPSVESRTWHVLILADTSFLALIERTEHGDGTYMFDGEVSGDCVRKNVTFFRKLVDGKVAGFYAVQTTFDDDLSGAKLVHEVFRFERADSDDAWAYPRFRKVAEASVAVRSCKSGKRRGEVIKLIRKH